MHDALVIGAGLSGLVCARRLVDAGKRVCVIEARDRIGGRLYNGNVGGAVVDLGGQWLTAGQQRLVALASDLGVRTYEHVRTGQSVVDEPGGLLAKIAAAFAQHRAIKKIQSMAAEPALDHVSLHRWLDDNVPNKLAQQRIRMHADLVFAADPADLSLLSYLTIMRATGGFHPEGEDLPRGGREHRFEGGAQLLCDRLRERIGDRIELHLGEPVTAIDTTAEDGVIARTRRTEHRGKRLVLAVPPAVVRRIDIDLPPSHRAFVDGVRTGAVVKIFAAYERAFWRERDLSGEAYLASGDIRAVVEIAGTPPVLLAFVVGPAAAGWGRRDAAERRALVLDTLAQHFAPDARDPIAYVEQDWAAEEWSGGCVAATPPGVLAGGARWREPHGCIHIAGTESAAVWPGYMDGAIEAGERAAAEVLAALR